MPTVVQSRSSTASADPTALAFSGNVVAGNSIFALLVFGSAANSVVGVTDSQSNSWAIVAGSDIASFRVEVWRAIAGASAACTVTADFANAPVASDFLGIIEASGMGTPTDGASNTLDQNVAADPMPMATLTTTGAGLILTGVRMDGAFTLSSFGDSFSAWGSATTRCAAAYRATVGGVSAAPTMDNATTETGESFTVVIYDQVIGGSVFPHHYYQQLRAM
jgi:hypothetical protein